MTEAADFLNNRAQVQWSLQPQGNNDILSASHPKSLATMAWTLPKARYSAVQIQSGSANVQSTDDSWLVRAETGEQLTMVLHRLP